MEYEHERDRPYVSPYVRSFMVLVVLGVLTALEYVVGRADELPVFSSNLAPLAVLAVLKAGVIINYYMHISRLWSTEEDDH
ncbi:MAG: cytochrome C oxidase subunit IV family protein [Chloroflexi bacterium]|nr:cytochrome C oxidase subunit IV family protein [Chloroflexota bacterium]